MNSSNPSFDLSSARARESSFFAGVYRWMATGLFITAASAFIAEEKRQRYVSAFSAARTRLLEIANAYGDTLELLDLRGDVAIFRTRVTIAGVQHDADVEFARDRDGIWRLKFF